MNKKEPRSFRLANAILDIAEKNQIPPDELMECAVNLLAHAIGAMDLCQHLRPKMVAFAMEGVAEAVEGIAEEMDREEAEADLEACDHEAWLAKSAGLVSGFDMSEPPQIVTEWSIRKRWEGGVE